MEEKFDVTGMTCAACQANVTRVVSKLDGVSHCDVSLLSNSMKVEFDQDKVNEQVICEAVKQIGYGASVHGERNGRIVRTVLNRIKEVLNKD
jgi:Cu+-exporting ATPase